MTTPVLAVVDDYQPFVEYLAAFLRARGYDVRAYSSGDCRRDPRRRSSRPGAARRDHARDGRSGYAAGAEGDGALGAGEHVVGAQSGVDRDRGGASRRARLPRRAGRPEGLAEIALGVAVKDALARLEQVKQIPLPRETLHGRKRATVRMARLDADVARAFPTDVAVNEALRKMMRGDAEEQQ